MTGMTWNSTSSGAPVRRSRPGTLLTTTFTERCRGNCRYHGRCAAMTRNMPLPASGRGLSLRAAVQVRSSRLPGSASPGGSGTIVQPGLFPRTGSGASSC